MVHSFLYMQLNAYNIFGLMVHLVSLLRCISLIAPNQKPKPVFQIEIPVGCNHPESLQARTIISNTMHVCSNQNLVNVAFSLGW